MSLYREYIVWDMCCGVGNLEVKHSNPRNIYMSTLDQADVDVMKATKTCVAAQRFQYDYLNDDIKSPPAPLFQRGEPTYRAAIRQPDDPSAPLFQRGELTQRPLGKRGRSEAEGDFLSAEAQAVLDAGRTLWQAYFSDTDVRTVRDELKLNRADVGWYQIRNALKARNASGDSVPVDFTPFEIAYRTLSEKLQPQVFELGFLR